MSENFIDQAKILVKAGSGGDGCRSFYRDRYQRKGIPDGGDGGKGSDIIIKASRFLNTLLHLKYKQHLIGKNGSHGSGKHKKGKDAADITVSVPVGTTIKEAATGFMLRDLIEDNQEVIVAKGGRGGLGNRGSREATRGEAGEGKELIFDLKLLAEVGVVGFPNAGKSTLIASISNATPLVAAYPFTTKTPVLGVVNSVKKKFTIADIPGLISGSSKGKGLGDRFLRHIERTKVLIHVIDMSGFEGRSPVGDYYSVMKELNDYSPVVAKKPQIIAANKSDLPNFEANLGIFKKRTRSKIFPISALKKTGLEDLIEAVAERL